MNKRLFYITIITITVITTIIILSYFIFVGTAMKECMVRSTPAAVPPEDAGIQPAPGVSYQIPANSIPTQQELEVSIIKEQKKREIFKATQTEIENARIKRRLEEKKAALQRVEAAPVPMPEKKETVLPTPEQRKEMASKGVISF